MAVPKQLPTLEYCKRKRRRRQDKPAVSARLVLDDHVKGDVGIFSEDLFSELFPGSATDVNGNGTSHDETSYVAITPWVPTANVEDTEWTIVPVRSSSALAHSTIQFSPSSLALQGFAEALQRNAASKLIGHSRSGIEIQVLDVLPLKLDTVFVTIEEELAKRLENGEGTFHANGWKSNGNNQKQGDAKSSENLLTSAVREALAPLDVVHMGDYFGLPLAPHPVTHLPPEPARVTLCEPVGQGILSANTKIIVTRTHHRSKASRQTQPIQSLKGLNEDEEDTANDQFYSAAEDRYKTDNTATNGESVTESEEDLSAEDDNDLSDDSIDDMISLQAPVLSSASLSGVSTLQAGTPRTVTLGRGTNGINTPGSMYTTMTATTARMGNQKGGLFKAQGLLCTLPIDILHPQPNNEDDEEVRVFVDVKSLAKIGCFSGDWVRLETAAEPPATGTGLWGLDNFGLENDLASTWRPARVYSLPETFSNRPVTKIPKRKQDERRPSFFESQVQKPSSPTVYLSPILLSNLDNSPYLRLSPLRRPNVPGNPLPKITGASMPPYAREITLAKIATPFASERPLQTAFLAGLKRYFGQRIRLVNNGDLVGIPIDGGLGSTLYQPSSTDDTGEELLTVADLGNQSGSKAGRNTGIAWFKIHHVTNAKTEANVEDADDVWGGLASIDPSSTRMVQTGIEKGKLPVSAGNAWEYYLGLRTLPKRDLTSGHKMLPEPSRQYITPLRRRLRELLAAATSPRAIHMKLPPLAILLVSTQRNIGKATVASRACTDIGLHTFTIDAYDILSEGGAGGGDVKTEAFLKARAERAMTCGPEFCALLIRHVEALTADRITSTLKEVLADSRVLVATTTEVDKVPDGIRGLFTHELEMNAPDEFEREGILRGIVEDHGAVLASEVDMASVAVKTAALVAGDLVDVVDRALVAKRERVEAVATQPITVRDVQVSGGSFSNCLTKSDFDLAVDAARKNFADAIGAPKIPNVGWNDVGGLSNVKDAVMETIQLPLERPELFAKGMKKRSGILFYGPPGTGKTLLAKAIATEFSLNFFSVKGPELLNMYIGESEANVRRVFQRARDARPCVVFFDELDSVAPKRGNQGDSGGVMDRIVSQLLAELDGMSDGEEGAGGVFVIGATNRPDLLDAALLRPGRFDKMLYLGVSDTHEKQLTIMEALTRKFTLHPDTSLRRVADMLPFTYTGADFYALCSDAMLKAVTRQASAVDEKIKRLPGGPVSTAYFFDHYATKDDIAVMVTEDDFLAAQRELIPSVSAKELEHYARVRQTFEAVEEKEAPQPGISEWQRPHRASVSSNHSSRSSNKGKSRNGKGKGKARASFEEDESDDLVNGNEMMSSKGKGKSIGNGFRDTTLEDDEDLY